LAHFLSQVYREPGANCGANMAQTFKGSSRLACTVFDGWRRPQQNAFDYSLLQVPL
jgi:hypothetical protein